MIFDVKNVFEKFWRLEQKMFPYKTAFQWNCIELIQYDVFVVEYITPDFKAVFFTLNPKIILIFSNQIKFLRYKL